MDIYRKIKEIGPRFFKKSVLFKYVFNYSPAYRKSTARIITVSDDLLCVRVKLPISYKNRNFVNTIFGGILFAAVDPIPMAQLVNIIGDDYVVWDKSAEIFFKKPARESLFADFSYTLEELDDIKNRVEKENEIEIVKTTLLQDKSGEQTYCEVNKTIYVASRAFFDKKRAKKKQLNKEPK